VASRREHPAIDRRRARSDAACNVPFQIQVAVRRAVLLISGETL